jgi:D-alanyl-D-alanine carboxypeptidase (penicillin-binding protein 5/6)
MGKFVSTTVLLSLVFGAAPLASAVAPRERAPRTVAAKVATSPASAEEAETNAEDDAEEMPLAARGAIVIDALSGATLFEKECDSQEFPASTTKIMTALLVIEEGDLDREVEVTIEDSKVGESSLEIKPGDRFTRRQMLYGLMLKSANDVAHALGRDNAGSIEAFAEKMTRRARELGAVSTHFTNPHGLHDPQHFTTPRDLAVIARAAMQQPLFRQIVGTEKHPWVTDTEVRELSNHNRLLTRFAGCTGVKTGYTRPAQQVLVSAALRDNREVIAVVMHTNKPGIWNDSTRLLTFGLEHTPAGTVAQAGHNSFR